ncbi:hypothetical protein B0H16DRAFT_1530612 [Mycena metata]|uniref:Uncharacterized protein n=1 Tax=Mycena metata TaxID=1033252 RepID=A0AAD7NIU3_9AGAR|nr:hypothetical protein B0H16DRAFT_1530612 [Mycena metata]
MLEALVGVEDEAATAAADDTTESRTAKLPPALVSARIRAAGLALQTEVLRGAVQREDAALLMRALAAFGGGEVGRLVRPSTPHRRTRLCAPVDCVPVAALVPRVSDRPAPSALPYAAAGGVPSSRGGRRCAARPRRRGCARGRRGIDCRRSQFPDRQRTPQRTFRHRAPSTIAPRRGVAARGAVPLPRCVARRPRALCRPCRVRAHCRLHCTARGIRVVPAAAGECACGAGGRAEGEDARVLMPAVWAFGYLAPYAHPRRLPDGSPPYLRALRGPRRARTAKNNQDEGGRI